MKKNFWALFFAVLLIILLFGCGTSLNETDRENNNTLNGYWELETFNIIYAADNNTAQKLKKMWFDNQIGFRIVEDTMRLYLWAKTPSPQLDSGESITEVTDESPCFKIYFSEELDDGRIKISVFPYIGYTKDDGIDFTLYWTKEKNKLSCLYNK